MGTKMPNKKARKPVTFSEARSALRATGKFKNVKIRLAESSRVERYHSEVRTILSVLGFPEALVTDDSAISDFGLPAKKLEAASRKLGAELSHKLFWEVARDMRGGK
jgi:hypothetical protein